LFEHDLFGKPVPLVRIMLWTGIGPDSALTREN
jgi:hypothetical protein